MYHFGEVFHRDQVWVVAADVDLTLLDTLTPWLDHFGVKKCDIPVPAEGVCQDLVPWITENRTKNFQDDVLGWWKNGEIYREAQPLNNVGTFLSQFAECLESESGFPVQLILVSSCFPEHEAAKWARVEELFPNTFSAKISTSSKHFVDFDVIIDDSIGVAKNCLDAGKFVIMPNTGLGSLNAQRNKNLIVLNGEYPHCFDVDYVGVRMIAELFHAEIAHHV